MKCAFADEIADKFASGAVTADEAIAMMQAAKVPEPDILHFKFSVHQAWAEAAYGHDYERMES